MTKIELQARVLIQDLANQELSSEQKTVIVETALKNNAADLLNQLAYFKDKAVPAEVIKELMSQAGINLDLRTNKFA